MKLRYSILLFCFSISLFSQKKVLDHKDYEIWNQIKNDQLSPNGKFVKYELEKGERDKTLLLKDIKGNLVLSYPRVSKSQFTYDSKYVLFTVNAWKDSIVELKRRKVKKEKLPKDTLVIYNIKKKSLVKIPNVKSFSTPEEWSGTIAYYLEDVKTETKKEKEDDKADKKKKKKTKKVGKKTGFHLVLRDLASQKQDTFKFVTNYSFAKKTPKLVYVTSGKDKESNAGVVTVDVKNGNTGLIHESKKGKYHQLSLSESGKHIGFVADLDTTKIQVRPNELFAWNEGDHKATKLIDSHSAPDGYRVSSDGKIHFSKDESKLFFGLAKPPIVKDTTLIDEEIVNVEVWTYDEPRLYTVQELQVERDKKKSFETAIHLNKGNKLVQIASLEYPNTQLGTKGNSKYALVSATEPYDLERQWQGHSTYDYAIRNIETGELTKILEGVYASVRLSPNAEFAYGYDMNKSEWFAYHIVSNTYKILTNDSKFYDELNDSPRQPSSYRFAGWTENDASILIYDRYDVWKFDPKTGEQTNLTNGREEGITYRVIKLDRDKEFIDTKEDLLLSTFNNATKHSGYGAYNFKKETFKQLVSGPFNYSTPEKALLNNQVIYTRSSFKDFPNIRTSDLSFNDEVVLSDGNPQQGDYNWGTVELVEWESLDGDKMTGMLIKPENFDPNKKYPMLVNFYERSSDRLFRHQVPNPGRSSINYSFYASRGYVIFNPDVKYKIGYPGESAYNCVVPGVEAMIAKGFIDKDNIGVQGHSWGGYQIAHLVTKTDIFKAAESGAPVPNMISAYGGIRWWTGLSRQFQYEHTQSRLGATLWEKPELYIENSPIFNIDKINTPLLIMHNDADGHVPWYQGIEFFVALRRLGKPSWFLNYNEEPHWPLKMQNRKDFQMRMAQFFDHYLKGEAKPVWMDRGVPAIEKGINQGLELVD
ncbi:alpha/beta hydrolase family protein [Urechidicola vernalis]|uniref:Prolyl oligopeptidase family serine peptidase n=1 Tax=Urechidicola vernalis TaxID=3075600 RepID=A0ABU2Y1D5_9FLAO|nr:prolyl oligopeptidase family serine peptidase [Urechidicola sp. P050]MDT0551956.1 prolyl oligopeptidase family serine peptidase [Urechidicola sp. P050]